MSHNNEKISRFLNDETFLEEDSDTITQEKHCMIDNDQEIAELTETHESNESEESLTWSYSDACEYLRSGNKSKLKQFELYLSKIPKVDLDSSDNEGLTKDRESVDIEVKKRLFWNAFLLDHADK